MERKGNEEQGPKSVQANSPTKVGHKEEREPLRIEPFHQTILINMSHDIHAHDIHTYESPNEWESLVVIPSFEILG
jgi:hypothetical protein